MTQILLDLTAGDMDRYNELSAADGSVRPHWQTLVARLTAQGPVAARRGLALAQQLIVENGVTYNVYADPQGTDRPWALDPLPLLLAADEWAQIEAGVAQRARLLDGLLADLYGPQSLLTEGFLPPEIAFGHPNFLWPCCGIHPAGGRWLQVYGVDLARGPDGRWWVLADRTQTPSGPGYALENRQIVSRVFPDLIHELNVTPLTDFFSCLRTNLLANAGGDAPPLAVVLTPGPFNETYFEHAYLARQLGLPLVVGQDLTVRGATVYLKTLAGLRRVHAIFRRLDDDFCDPVELRGDSALGVPGLLTAIRAGRVVMSNALGSGVLESAAWQGFLPGAARHVLGEKLLLPSVATWWCGESPALEEVLDRLDELVIKSTFPNQHFGPVFGCDLDDKGRDAMVRRLRNQPHAYVAQAQLSLSVAPMWRADGSAGFASRPMGMRVYAVATADGYKVMPGGLARIAADERAHIVSMQRGGGSKDVWVLGTEDVDVEAPAPNVQPIRHDDPPSRLVENLYWLGRYAERCEGKTRLLRATLALRRGTPTWHVARATCDTLGVMAAGVDPAAALFKEDSMQGLSADLRRLVWCATQVRGSLSTENWRAVSVMQREFQEAGRNEAEPRETLDKLLLALAGLAGFALDDMTRDNGWRMMMVGRRIERMQAMANLLARRLGNGRLPSQAELEWLLDVGDSTITYRTRYLSAPQLSAVISLLVLDEDNPRAVGFQCVTLLDSLKRLAAALGGQADDLLLAPMQALRDVDLNALNDRQASAERIALAGLLEGLSNSAASVSDRLTMRHFNHVDMHMVAV